MKGKVGWLYNALLLALLITNFVILRRLDASERTRERNRTEYREFRQNVASLAAQNNIKHSELTAELKLLKAQWSMDTQRIRRLERVIPVEAIADRAR